jgi:hypothetical protein
MSDSRGSRFALEVLFLVALAVVLALAELRPVEIGGIMLVGWVIVAALEWAAWRERPHYGSGLPPRYYVPQVSLPPAQPLEQVSNGYPEARDEAPTWIASAALREEMLGEWPVARQPVRQDESEPEPVVEPDPWTHAEELPAAPLDDREPVPEPAREAGAEPVPLPVAVADAAADEPQPVPEPSREAGPEPVPLPDAVADAAADEPEPAPEPSREAERVPLPGTVADEPEPVPEPSREAEPAPVPLPAAVADDPEPEPVPEPSREAEPAPDETLQPDPPEPAVLRARAGTGVARYSLDPLAEPPRRRRFGRRGDADAPAVEVAARPEGVRALPGRATRQD